MTEEIKSIVENVIGTKVNIEVDLFKVGLDSLGVLKLITYIEDHFNIEIDDDDIIVENLSTIQKVEEVVKKYIEN